MRVKLHIFFISEADRDEKPSSCFSPGLLNPSHGADNFNKIRHAGNIKFHTQNAEQVYVLLNYYTNYCTYIKFKKFTH